MRDFLARRPSPAMAVAFVALLAALSGTAIALPGTNTVDSGDIKNRQVKGKDIARNAVTGGKVKNRSLSGADVRDESLTGADINESTLGQVPSANSANSANTANSADTANTANAANTANSANSADNANNLGGEPAASYARYELPSGATLRGRYSIDNIGQAGDQDSTDISFGLRLSAAPTPRFIAQGAAAPAQCPGTAANPEALPGNLCVYEAGRTNGNVRCIFDPVLYSCPSSSRNGAAIYFDATAAGFYTTHGSWAVTAP